jgi:hypothetical protein
MYQLCRKINLLLLAVLLMPSALQAAVLEDFYRVEMAGDPEKSRDQALSAAFELMLVRQAGSAAAESQALETARQDPKVYMRRIAGTEAGGVRVEFESTALRSLLANAGMPMLGPNRPTVMLWAVENRVLGTDYLSQGSEWVTVLNDAARRRAVALSLPLADLEDRSLVAVENISQANEAILKQASKRYDASAVLALTIEGETDAPVLSWHWWLNDQADSGQITAQSPAAAADQLMLLVADKVFEQYAVAPSDTAEGSDWEVVVDGIDSVDEFAGLQRTLQQLGSKNAPQVLSVTGDQVRLALDFSGTEAQLERLLALDQRMRRMPAPEPEPAEPLPEAPVEQVPDSAVNLATQSAEEAQSDITETNAAQREADVAVSAGEPEAAPAPEPLPPQNRMYFRWR